MYDKIHQEVQSAKDINGKIKFLLIDAHLHFVENNSDFCRRIFLRVAKTQLYQK